MRATDLPGWVWMRGMTTTDGRVCLSSPGVVAWNRYEPGAPEPDLDDPATGGAMLALLGEHAWRVGPHDSPQGIRFFARLVVSRDCDINLIPTLGQACLAVALSLGRWPGVREV